jgi:hypothetical protein
MRPPEPQGGSGELTEEFLHGADVGPFLKQMRSEGVA